MPACRVCEEVAVPKGSKLCDSCAERLPTGLAVAIESPGDVVAAVGLPGGITVVFDRATIKGDAITLYLGGAAEYRPPLVMGLPEGIAPADGLSTRLDHIQWACELAELPGQTESACARGTT